jgi:hypothetical protein
MSIILQTYVDHFTGLCRSFYRHMSIILQTYVYQFTCICRSFYRHMSIILHAYVDHFIDICRSFYRHMSIILQTYVDHFKNFCRSFYRLVSIILQVYVNHFTDSEKMWHIRLILTPPLKKIVLYRNVIAWIKSRSYKISSIQVPIPNRNFILLRYICSKIIHTYRCDNFYIRSSFLSLN